MMNENAMPNSASASIKPIPMNMVVRTWPAYSGWRAMASTDFPIKIPSPIPGPMAARPMTRPLPIVASPSRFPVTCAMNANIQLPPSLVRLRLRLPDVGGAEHGEDERLQGRDEDLEPDEHQREWERYGCERPGLRAVLEEEDGPQEEDRQQEVPGHEVGRETDGEGDRPHDDVGDEFDRHQQPVPEDRGGLRDDGGVPEVAEEPVLSDPDGVVREPRDERQHEPDRDAAARREAEARHDLEHV